MDVHVLDFERRKYPGIDAVNCEPGSILEQAESVLRHKGYQKLESCVAEEGSTMRVDVWLSIGGTYFMLGSSLDGQDIMVCDAAVFTIAKDVLKMVMAL